MFKFFDSHFEYFAKYDTFCSHIFNYACLRRKGLYLSKRFEIIRKLYASKTCFENGWWEDAYRSFYPSGFAPGHKLQKPSKKSGIVQSLGTISIISVYWKAELKRRGGAWRSGSPLNTLLRAGFKQWEALDYLITLIGRAKKRSSRPQNMSCFHCKYQYSEEQKKRYTRPQMFCFTLKVSVKRKNRLSLFVMRPLIFYKTLGISLLSLYVNPALCLQSIFSLARCDVSNLCLQTHGSCF